MRVNVGSENPVKVDAVCNVFRLVFPQEKIEVVSIDVLSGVPAQPFDDDVARGAIIRAKNALSPGVDFGVGIEAGLILQPEIQSHFDVQYCAIVDRQGKITLGHGSGFLYPLRILDEAKLGKTVGEAMTELTGIEQIGNKMGAIGFLSRGLLNRTALTEQAVLMALIPRIRSDLY